MQKEHANVVDEFAALHTAAGIPHGTVQRDFGSNDTFADVDYFLPRHSPLLTGSQVTNHSGLVTVIKYRKKKKNKINNEKIKRFCVTRYDILIIIIII